MSGLVDEHVVEMIGREAGRCKATRGDQRDNDDPVLLELLQTRVSPFEVRNIPELFGDSIQHSGWSVEPQDLGFWYSPFQQAGRQMVSGRI